MGIDLVQEILRLKKEKNAIILAHYYQPGIIQELADFVGDSYYLSEIARDCKEEVIMFCELDLWQKVQKFYLHIKQF